MGKTVAKKKVLVLSHDKVGGVMAGPGIRYHNIAQELSKYFEVTLGVYSPNYKSDLKAGYRFRHVDLYKYHKAFDEHDFIIAMWLSDDMVHYAQATKKILIFDFYAPVHVELLVSLLLRDEKISITDDNEFRMSATSYGKFFTAGDLFTCSNERQRDWWTGFAFGANAVVPSEYLSRKIFENFVLAPMGIDSKSPKHTKNVLKGVVQGIKKSDFVIVWTGGIWDWFDGITPVKAMAKLAKEHPSIKLVFLGTEHPNKDAPPGNSEAYRTIQLADELELSGKSIFFLGGWLGYEERINYLLEADAAIYAHKNSIEVRYSHRTRVLDHILTSLPTIATRGDYFADIIEHDKLGVVVDVADPNQMAEAILDAKKNFLAFKKNIQKAKAYYFWSSTLQPVKDYIANLDIETAKSQKPKVTYKAPTKPIVILKRFVPKSIKRQVRCVIKKKN